MTEKESALHSQYIIDGIICDATPAELLNECMSDPAKDPADGQVFADIIDESTDPPVSSFTYDNSRDIAYAAQCAAASAKERPFRMLYPDAFTRLRIADCLIERIWNDGHFRLGDLEIWARWTWNTRPLGNMAAFHKSAEAAGEYIFGLGIRMNDYIFEETDEESHTGFYAWLPEGRNEEDDYEVRFKESPFESHHPWISESRKCPAEIIADPASWLIYIPFDTCSHSIGGSLLAQLHGHNGGPGLHIQDPDYFIDCFEVVRELVEDGIVMSGATVSDGGLGTAAARICGGKGIELDISGLMSSHQEKDTTKMLFGEVPGVLLQISDNDYDYLDSQLLLQDVAYYPVGHPSAGFSGIRLINRKKADVAGILASLLGQASEGED